MKSCKRCENPTDRKAPRCEKSILCLPFLLHGLMDILLTLAVGQKYKRPEIRIYIFETGGTLAAGLFLSGGLVREAPLVTPMINVTIVDNQVTGGLAVVAILVISGLGFALWRAALAAYRGIVATAKTGWKIFFRWSVPHLVGG